MFMKKRGVSPIIASILLIAIVVLLAAIIFWWARGFFSESVQKMGRDAEQVCQDVKISASRHSDGIDIVNTGNVPIHGASIKKYELGKSTTDSIVFTSGVSPGKSYSIDINHDIYDRIIIIPAIMGKSDGAQKLYTCDEELGVSA